MPISPTLILEDLSPFYQREEYPILLHQYETWFITKPLQGYRIIDASPIFRNTCAKYAALLAAGASLTVAISPIMPHDPNIVSLLKQYGVSVLKTEQITETYDVVMDCAGVLRHVKSRYGYVELTRSGAQFYQECKQPVWMVDAGKIKQIETCLGTGESFFRTLENLGIKNTQKKTLVVIGYGKVGRGIVLHAINRQWNVIVADVVKKTFPLPYVSFISTADKKALNNAIRHAFCAVTATGCKHALSGLIDPTILLSSPVYLANMGVEDEWGPEIPKERLLNAGNTLNFILSDPTKMCYIDPPLAIHNQGAVELIAGRVSPGIFPPPIKIENEYLTIIRNHGSIPTDMLNWIS